MDNSNEWKLPETLIKKFGLIDEGRTMGSSFAHDAKIFTVPEIGGVYIAECDGLGEPVKSGLLNVFFIVSKGRSSTLSVTIDIISDLSPGDFLKFLNNKMSAVLNAKKQ